MQLKQNDETGVGVSRPSVEQTLSRKKILFKRYAG